MSKDKKETKPQPQNKDAAVYNEYIHGASPQSLADKYELDVSAVLAIIEGKQGA